MVRVTASSESESSAGRWIHTRSRRVHTHDVRSISIWPPVQLFPKIKGIPSKSVPSSDADAPVIVSGGLDMSVVLTPCIPPAALGTTYYNPIGAGPASSFEDAYYRRISYGQLTAGGSRIVQLARQARCLLCRRETGISIWYVRPQVAKSDHSPGTSSSGGWDKLLDMELKVESTLVSSAISDDGTWLAVSDAYETKLFHLMNEVWSWIA
jgi:U3 small nucleolar RNA-associated protein 4